MSAEGRLAFDEILSGGKAPSALDAILEQRVCVDPDLFKIAQALHSDNPEKVYAGFGGGYVLQGEKFGQTSKGGLKNGIDLYPYQRDAISKVIEKDGNLLLSHPTGSGKTLTAIAAFEEMRKRGMAHRALVVAPAGLRTNFLDGGVNKFTTSKGVIFGSKSELSSGSHVSVDAPDKDAHYHIVSYELFRTDPKKYIDAAGADTLIYDEAHKVKNEGVLTTKAMKDARQHHKNFIAMTGSIVSNTPADIVPLVDAMTDGKHLLGNKTTFEARFVSVDDRGNKRLKNPQVIRSLLAPYVHHLDAAELETKAPKRVVEEVRVDMSTQQKDLYKFIKQDLDPLTELRLRAGISSLNAAQLNDMFAQLLRLRQVSNSIHTMDTRVTPEQSAKITPKIKKILDDVEEHLVEVPDGQVVLHTNMIHGGVDVLTAGLKDRGIDHALFIGKGNKGVTEKVRQQGVKEFQEGKKKVIVLSSAGGEGLNLPNTTFMAMVDGHFNPEKIYQAESRGVRSGGQAHRPEPERRVLIRRYVTVLPTKGLDRTAEVLKNVLDQNPANAVRRLVMGGPGFYNPFKREESTDEWVYGVAKNKNSLNASLREQIKTSSAVTTHEDFEELLLEEKRASTALQVARYAVPAVLGGVAGGLVRGSAPPRKKRYADQDPGAVLRNRASAAVGGALGGLALGALAKRDPEYFNPFSGYSLVLGGASAGRAIANLFAPPTAVPASVHEVLGKRQMYTDRALFEEYWNRFGKELETGGVEAKISDEAMESKFVAALKDLYEEGKDSPHRFNAKKNQVTRPGKGAFVAASALGLIGAGIQGAAAEGLKSLFTEKKFNPESAALHTIPHAVETTADLIGAYRNHYIDPGVAVSSRAEARTRSKFDSDQLRQLLRGLSVDEVKTKSHVIK